MKTTINPYFNFNDNCREAMTFYKECFGGNLTLQTVGESPLADHMPPQMQNSILHAALTVDALVIMGSDIRTGELKDGNTVQLNINCKSEEELNALFAKLSADGKVTNPIAAMPWGAKLGTLTDKFGKNWMFNFEQTKLN